MKTNGSRRILVADDEECTRFGVRLALQLQGYSVECVTNGAEALHKISLAARIGHPYDLLICDIQMPHINGEEVLRRCETLGLTLPVIIISGNAAEECVTRFPCCAGGFIGKPFDPDILVERVEKVLAGSGIPTTRNSTQHSLTNKKDIKSFPVDSH